MKNLPAPEQVQRLRFVDAARSFIGTPYHHEGRIKGVGIDCATLLAECAVEAGLVESLDIPAYPRSWHVHQEEERYTDFIRQFASEVDRPPLPGDVVVWKFHKAFAHGGIVVEWPTVIHAFIGRGCFEDDAEANQMLSTISERVPGQGLPRPKKFFSYWAS